MREGWICPQCRRGLAPEVRECDHGRYAVPVSPVAPVERPDLPRPYRDWDRTPVDQDIRWYMPPVTCGPVRLLEGTARSMGTK